MIRIELDVVTDTLDEAYAVLDRLASLGIATAPDLGSPAIRPHLAAVPTPQESAS